MSNTPFEGCGQYSFLIPLHGSKGGPLHPRHVEEPRRADTTPLRLALDAVIERARKEVRREH